MAYVARVLLEDIYPPWRQGRVTPAPGGGTSFNWMVMKHTLLCWPSATIQTFGDDIFEALLNKCAKNKCPLHGGSWSALVFLHSDEVAR